MNLLIGLLVLVLVIAWIRPQTEQVEKHRPVHAFASFWALIIIGAMIYLWGILARIGAIVLYPILLDEAAQRKIAVMDLITLAVFIIFTVTAFFVTRGTSYPRKYYASLLIYGALFASCLSPSTLALLNGWLDSSVPQDHGVWVRGKQQGSTDRKSASDFLTVESWRPGREMETIMVDRQLFDQVMPNATRVYVRTHSGKFGFEWIQSVGLSKADLYRRTQRTGNP